MRNVIHDFSASHHPAEPVAQASRVSGREVTGAPWRSIGLTCTGGATRQPEIYRAQLFDESFN